MIAKLELWWSSICVSFFTYKNLGNLKCLCISIIGTRSCFLEMCLSVCQNFLDHDLALVVFLFVSCCIVGVLMSHAIRKAMDNCSTFFHAKVDHSCISCDPLLYCVYLLWLSCFTFFWSIQLFDPVSKATFFLVPLVYWNFMVDCRKNRHNDHGLRTEYGCSRATRDSLVVRWWMAHWITLPFIRRWCTGSRQDQTSS
jgi:hypothetical protein